jgi:hypothetical protein
MQPIEIDFDVFKALTSKRESESHSYNDVLRELLGLGVSRTQQTSQIQSGQGRLVGGRFLPNGTLLRAQYKGQSYSASIENGQWVSETGEFFDSASAAAKRITNNNVNGLTFWEARRPTDDRWIMLKSIPKQLKLL